LPVKDKLLVDPPNGIEQHRGWRRRKKKNQLPLYSAYLLCTGKANPSAAMFSALHDMNADDNVQPVLSDSEITPPKSRRIGKQLERRLASKVYPYIYG
jgi:hypothetical protein